MTAVLKVLQRLFSTGTCAADHEALAPLLTGLAHLSVDGGRWVISRQLLGLRQTLSGDQEAIAAVLATQLELCTPWARLLAGRCREAGQLADANVLVQLVSRLGGAAAWVDAAMPQASLDSTTAKALERELFGFTGRLLAQPDSVGSDEDFILCGRWPGEEGSDPFAWVQRNPWPLLLAAIGYVQDSWAAEARGGLLLELPPGQYPHYPTEVAVLVAGDDGAEVLCGSLGGFVLGLLSRLNMALFPAPLSEAALNARLSPLIGELQRRQVWRFQEGLSGQQGFYRIHPKFSDACYQINGVRTLGLNGRGLRRAIREQAEQWRIERQGLKS